MLIPPESSFQSLSNVTISVDVTNSQINTFEFVTNSFSSINVCKNRIISCIIIFRLSLKTFSSHITYQDALHIIDLDLFNNYTRGDLRETKKQLLDYSRNLHSCNPFRVIGGNIRF